MSGQSEQLLRLLRLIPLAARPEGLRLADAAHLCEVPEGQIRRDFDLLIARAWYLPPGRTDDFQVLYEGDRIHIHAPPAFERPIRLGLHEMLAISLALRCAGVERTEARELCRTLEAACAMEPDRTTSSAAAESVEFVLDRGDVDDIHDELGRAVVHRRQVRIGYVKAEATLPEVRRLEPWYLLHAEGEGYLLAHDVERNAPRLFRLDRILGARMTQIECTEPITIDPSEIDMGGAVRLVAGERPEEFALVRYSPRVARWMQESHPGEDGEDGSYLVRHRILTDEWVVRHVLRFGVEAEILEPERLRRAVVRAVRGEVRRSG